MADLPVSPLQAGGIPNAAQPTPGQGFTLPIDGTQPLMLAALGSRKIAFGTGTLTWPGGAGGSNNVAVTHGLGVTPVSVVITGSSDSGPWAAYMANTLGAKTFSVNAHTTDGSSPAAATSQTFYWFAIG